ncbi:hypothetical protein, partial [Micromonospora sp. NPDC003776]
MTTSRRLPFAAAVLVTAGAVLLGTAAAAAPPQPAARGACDPIDPTACLLPFPNDYFTVPDSEDVGGVTRSGLTQCLTDDAVLLWDSSTG